jgi:hypothetical protein
MNLARNTFVPLAVAILVLPFSSFSTGAGDGKEKTAPKVTLTLHFPGETKGADVLKIAEKLKSLKDVELLLRMPEEGKGVYAEISIREPYDAKAVGAVVEELLRLGIRRISIDVKKA